MPAFRRTTVALALLLAAPLPALAPALALAEDAGITGAVNTDVTGTPPGGSTANLEVGKIVVRDEHIVSDTNGLAQLLFLDQTTLTVGPNSDIVIDEFVYDPTTKDGKLLMEASVGVFRVIGGESSTSGGISVTTPFATMGIRGSNVVIEVLPNGKTRVTCNYCDQVEIQLLSDPSKLVTIFGSDRFRTIEIGPDGFSAPFELTPEEIALLQDLLTSRPGQNGGIANIPVEPDVSRNVNGNNNSNNPPSGPGSTPPVQQGYNDQNIGNPQEQTEGAQDQNEQQNQGNQNSDNPPVPTLLFTGGSYISTGGGVITFAEGGPLGWSGSLQDPDHTQAIVSATQQGAQLVLQLAGGDSYTLPWQGGSFSVEGAGTPGGLAFGSGFVSPNGDFFVYKLIENDSGKADLLFGGQAADPADHFGEFMAWDLQPDELLGSAMPFLASSSGVSPENIAVSPLYYVSDQVDGGTVEGKYGIAALGFEGTGPGQTSAFMVAILDGNAPTEGDETAGLYGQVRGFANVPQFNGNSESGVAYGNLATVDDGNGNAFFGGADGTYFVIGSGKWGSGEDGDIVYAFSTDSEGGYAYEPINVATPSDAPVPGSFDERESFYHTGYAAGAADLNSGNGYVLLHGNVQFDVLGEGGTNAQLYLSPTDDSEAPFNNLYVGFGNAVVIDRERILMQEDGAIFDDNAAAGDVLGAFATYQMVRQPDDILPGGATACTCAFMEWGFWAADVYEGEEGNVATIPIGTWVAGDQADYYDMPEGGTASYEGHAIANIVTTIDGVTSSYVASGALSMEVDFGSRDINGSIGNLDNRDYAFSADYTGFSGANYTTYGQSTDGQVDLQMNGGFFAGPDSPVQGVGGEFSLSPSELGNVDYHGAGTFMGEQVPN